MKFLIVFACALAAASAGHIAAPFAYGAQHLPVIGHNGVPVDTAAVQQATAEHLAHKVDAHARNGDFAIHAPVVSAYSAYAHAPVSSYAHAAPVVAYAAQHQAAAYPTTAVLPTSVNGVPQETPEVVAATHNHFVAHAEAHARNGDFAIQAPVVSAYSAYAHAPLVSSYAHAAPVVSTYAHAAPVVAYAAQHQVAAYPTTAVHPTSVNGVPQETPEVVAATHNHFVAHAEAHARNGDFAIQAPVVSAYSAYAHAPVVSSYAHATPVVAAYAAHHQAAAYPTTAVLPTSVNGVPQETPEVVAATHNHFVAHAEANARTAIHRYRRGVIAAPAYSAYAYGAQHLPVIGANGVPVDTADVQIARANHFAHKAEAHVRNGDFAYGYAAPAYAHAAYAHATPVVSAYGAYPYAAQSYGYGYSSPLARFY